MNELDDALLRCLRSRRVALWIEGTVQSGILNEAAGLPWVKIWSSVSRASLSSALAHAKNRKPLFFDRPDDAPQAWNESEYIVVYDVQSSTTSDRLELVRRQAWNEGLKQLIQGWDGIILILTERMASLQLGRDIELISALAPASIIVLQHGLLSGASADGLTNLVTWQGPLLDFVREALSVCSEQEKVDVLDLKHASGVRIEGADFDVIAGSWTLLRRGHLAPASRVSQKDFDHFLSGTIGTWEVGYWQLMSAGISHDRGGIANEGTTAGDANSVDPVALAVDAIKALDFADRDPSQQVDVLTLAAESGSGCTTLLRQLALAVARAGYPTFISQPNVRDLSTDSLADAVVAVQSAWAAARDRSAKGSGHGTLPVCIIVDADAELQSDRSRLMSKLQSLGRKVYVVRALTRSRSEMAELPTALHLKSEATENQILALGRHLSAFGSRYGLVPLPSDDEWHSYYRSFKGVQAGFHGEIVTPPLFLVGLHIFVKDRVRDERSLEQYLYRKWLEIDAPSGKELVRVLAAAGSYGLAVPFETAARVAELRPALFGQLQENEDRALDVFCQWTRPPTNQSDWAVAIRHQALGVLLGRVLFPDQATAPYSALLPVLSTLTSKEEDRWFADNLAYRLGQRFGSYSAPFSLDVDTANQKAARAIFASFPKELRSSSRTILHHHARYYIKVLKACIEAIAEPEHTIEPRSATIRLAEAAADEAQAILDVALDLPEQNDRRSSLLTTLSAALGTLSRALLSVGSKSYANRSLKYFWDSIDAAQEAVNFDGGNGHANFNLIDTIQKALQNSLPLAVSQELELFEVADNCLVTLQQLHSTKRWSNVDDLGGQESVGGLIVEQLALAKRLSARTKSSIGPAFFDSPAGLMIRIREVVGPDDLSQAFRDPKRALTLRKLRGSFEDHELRAGRALQYLYKLYLHDPIGRLNFAHRRELLRLLKACSVEEYEPYRHDEATLSCQLGEFEPAETLFNQLREARQAEPSRWYWHNERVLIEVVEGAARPREFAIEVVDAANGWGRIKGLDRIRIKIQPNQFSGLSKGSFHRACVRFRTGGLQAVRDRFARDDLLEMGLA
ncbi:hypothetical protein IC762_05545 [Bradyrhizobium genosp. L]|uniref:hypothetical protein n=1 Tax=Bradyrhizobium genosp. L TaxID=83637 RepID=UPI0018A2FADB|nr:hypothetical protein [Bradyrhizobium genosp. L]QPF85771.1 hypothetical protein IC762_05545 [Bradyrhizobium genosp. L]